MTPAGMRVTSALQVAPSAIEFEAFEADTCYVAALSVKNTSDRILRYRLVPPPHASPFRVLARPGGEDLARTSNPTVKVPPGLSVKYDVTFQVHSNGSTQALFHDALQLKGDDQSLIEVPLMARKACPILDVAPSLCDLGLVVLAQRAAQFVSVRNVGARHGKFAIEVLDASGGGGNASAIAVTPLRGKLAPNEALNVKIEVVGTELGVFRGVVRIRIGECSPRNDGDEGENNSDTATGGGDSNSAYQVEKLVDVCGKIVEHNVELVLKNGLAPVKNLYFGSMFAGESKVIETVLRNNGPLPLFFKTSLTFGGSGGGGSAGGAGTASSVSLSGDEEREAYERRKELQVSPAEGRVEPFAQLLVTFTYHPRGVDLTKLKQLEAKYRQSLAYNENNNNSSSSDIGSALPPPPIALNAFASIQCVDLQSQNLTFEVTGKAFLPKVELSPLSALDFGDVKSHDRVDMLLSLKNLSGLPVQFSIPKIAHFSMKPHAGRLDVLQSRSLVASFAPTQLGTFQSFMELSINKDVLLVPIHVKGRAAAVGDVTSKPIIGGITALPKDFAPQYKFLLPDEAKRTKGKLERKFNRMAPYELAALNGTAAIDEYEFEGTNNTHLTYCVKELAKRADHKAGYHEYLAACRLQREGKQRKKSATGVKHDISNARNGSNNNNESDEDSNIPGGSREDKNLGMDLQGGVQPRMLRLPPELKQQSEPLWLNQTGANGTGSKSKTFFDDTKFVKKKFKPQPATQAEIAECALNLDYDQLEQVLSGPKTLHFGKLSVNGAAKRSLSVQNNLPQNVFVSLHLRDEDHLEELASHTQLKSQVVPPRTLAGFDLIFSSATEQFFQKQLGFSINGVHKREITLVAEVAPIVVELSTGELQFEFSYMNTSPSMMLEVALTNTSDSVAPFQWSLMKSQTPSRPDSSKSNSTVATTTLEKSSSAASTGAATTKSIFEMLPASGSLSPNATVVCQVVYTPPTAGSVLQNYSMTPDKSGRGSWITSSFLLDITGGKKSTLVCKALVQELKVTAKEKKVDFGTISVGIEKEKKITLTNSSSDVASFSSSSSWATFYASIEPTNAATSLGLTLSPSVGTILCQESAEIVVKMFPHKPIVLDSSVVVHIQIRGGKSLKIPINATVLVPEVFITPQSVIGFGDVVLGVAVPRVVALENRSTIPASLFLDLESALSDEFAVVMPPKLLARLEDVSSVFIPMMDSKESSSSVKGNPSPGDSAESEADALCSRWQICIPPNTTVSFHLTFTPKKQGSHDQVLPVQISGVSNASAIARPESLTRRVTATAILPRLLFSSAVLDFHRCVITREGIRKVPYTKFLVLTNNDTKSVKWQIDTAQLKQMQMANPAASKRAGHTTSASASSVIFHLAPEKGELAPGEEVKIRVSFLPLEAVEYVEEEIPLLLDDQFYIHLSVKGEGIHPHLSFSENKLVLPTVPLGIVSRAKLFVQSTGYDHLDLTYRIPLDLAKAPVTLHFPKGKILSMACPKIPVEVRFCSKKSVAFNARIEFFDIDGNIFYLPIAGCTENCLLTNYQFLHTHRIGRDGDASHPGSQDTHGVSGALVTGERATHALKRQNTMDAPTKFEFYTHNSMRFPIYLLPSKQVDAELQKAILQQDQGGTQSSQLNGFIEVDASASVADDGMTLGSSLALIHDASTSSEMLSAAMQFSDTEVAFLLQYLNTTFLRNPVTKFPSDFADAWGKPLYELLEMVCTKKPSGGGVMQGVKAGKGGSGGGAGLQPSKKDLLAHYTSQYTELLKFLKSYGAMLHDIPPEHLLNQEFYIRACEDPRADPSILSSPGLAGMRFLQRRHVLEREWRTVCSNAWMKVLYQVIKCFLLYRITAKGYIQQQHTLRQQQSKSEIAPRACQGSNLYSEAEMVLLQWICDNVRAQQQPPEPTAVEAHLLDVRRDLLDGKFLFHLMASHIPTLTAEQSEYQCFRLDLAGRKRPHSDAQLHANAQILLQTLSSFGVDFGIDPTTFLLNMNAREMVVLLLHLNQTLPQFIPKATIEFKGVLGQVIEKSIELKNPSARALRYQVFLDGTDSDTGNGGGGGNNSTFSIESNSVVLEPGKAEAFVVTFRPRFSRKVTARLVFQSIREPSLSTSSSGATMVFLLESNIVSRKPVRVIQIETNTYEKKIEELVIENQFPAQAAYRLSMTQQQQQGSANAFNASQGGQGAPAISQSATPGQSRKKSVQGKERDRPNGVMAPLSLTNSSSSLTGAIASTNSVSKKNVLQTNKGREDTDFSWCMCAQQPFFLPEFSSSGSTASNSEVAPQMQSLAGLGVINIRNQGSATVKLEFLPLLPGTYKCQLLFLDEKIGEFMYEIHAVAHLPASLDTLKFQCETAAGAAGGTTSGANRFHFLRELVVPVKNPPLSRALVSYVERASGHLKTKLKEGLKRCEEAHHTSFQAEFNSPFFTSAHQEMTLSSTANTTKTQRSSASSLMPDTEPATSRTDQSSGTDCSGGGASKGPAKANQARLLTPRSNNTTVVSPNAVLIDFQPKGAGVYTCKLLLRSHHTICGSNDLRVYDLEAKVKEPNVKTLLEFAAPARHIIVQEIPLSNPSDSPWSLKASFSSSSSGGSMFLGPSTLLVPAKKTVSYPLTFSPKWISNERSSFTLVNPSTQQQFEFELNGYGEEPLAQDHVVISCQARTSVVHEFEVVSFKTDPHGAQHYKVESDLRDVKGAPTTSVPSAGGASVKYQLTFSPIVSGTYFGSITFTNEATKEYIWYTIEANVSPPEPETTLDMHAVVRGAIGVEISLANPLDHAVTFGIELQGEGLLGPTTFSLEAQESGVYELVYSPLMAVGSADDAVAPQDGAVLFSNDEIGQFWYRLQLAATPAPAQEMKDMCCAVGDVCSQPILLQNPSEKDLLLQYKVANTRNFSIKGGGGSGTEPTISVGKSHGGSLSSSPRVILPPFGQATVIVEYTPSSLSEYESTSIVFYEPEVVSDWEFVVKGIGKAPSVMKPILVSAKVHEAASTLFTFKNPFADMLRVEVKLVIEENEGRVGRKRSGLGGRARGESGQVFDILLKKSRIQMESFGHLQVPISFTPQFVCEARAEIVIRGSEDYSELEWRYPIHGIAEAPLHPRPFAFACQARDSMEKKILCELLAAPPDMVPSEEVFTVELDIPTERFGVLTSAVSIERSLSVSALSVEGETAQNASIFLPYHVRFDPLRPHRGSIYLLVKKKSGGFWRFEVVLDVSDPPIDDMITIESSLNQTSSITFQLRNQFRQSARFLAEFSAGSSSAFTVYPAEGSLPPYGSDEGMPFVVSFTPTGYGKMQSGQLVILTEEMQWTFNIKGTYPDTNSSKSSGPNSSLSSSASRYRLGISSEASPSSGSASHSPSGSPVQQTGHLKGGGKNKSRAK